MALPSYSTGTVSIDAGGMAATGAGTIWTGGNAREGDDIVVDGVIARIVEVVSATELTITKWTGGAASGAAYVIYQNASRRFDDVDIADDLRKQVSALNTEGFYHFVPPSATEPDPSLGDNGQYAFQATTGKLWLKTSGIWTFIGVYKGVNPRGDWDGVTAYAVNDVVSRNGSAYMATASNTNSAPPSANWMTLGAKGDRGNTGDTGAAATVEVGAITTGAAGSAATVVNTGTTAAAVLSFAIPQGARGFQGIKGDTGSGIQPDATGTLAGRSDYDGEPQNFVYLQTDLSPFRLWIKASATTGDWAGPTYIGGAAAIGDLGSVTDSIFETFDYGEVA